MASFLTDWLKRAIGNDDFSWTFSDVRVLLIASDPDYDPLPSPATVDSLVDFELVADGYERQPVTSRTIDGGTGGGSDGIVQWKGDDVVFSGLEPSQVRGAWLIDYRFDADDQSFLVAFLDFVGIGVSGDFRISFTDSVFFTVTNG